MRFKQNLQKKMCNFISNGFKLSLGFISDLLFGIIEVLGKIEEKKISNQKIYKNFQLRKIFISSLKNYSFFFKLLRQISTLETNS
ncbi:hypothetical protein BpHYR1_053366 [Brachionus plicatilis]|uniref:Uncharacterized protein n=1 Tax=Brachionus plicatilis TaxID=10195 RepID=A0A3M7S7J6_BRAPC|nr:hypothetical protein BpHYR1_053366 [Brachionus plicatilis]